MYRLAATLLVVALFAAGCSTPVADEDNDLIDDVDEATGRIINITFLTGVERRSVTSDPSLADTDGDGLLDGDELLVRGTDPRDVDTDDDGLLDGHDRAAPENATRDAWHAAGILEVDGIFLGELDGCPPGGPQLKPFLASSDVPFPDDLSDGEELRGWDIIVNGGTRHVTSDPCSPDTDGDGLLDHDEKLLGTDPRDPDTDKDGARDGSDADPAADLGIAFTALELQATNATVRVRFVVAEEMVDLIWPGNATSILDVPDTSATRESLTVSVIITAEDAASGSPIALFEDPRGVVVTFDLIHGTVSGADSTDRTLRFSGNDGTLTLRWETARR